MLKNVPFQPRIGAVDIHPGVRAPGEDIIDDVYDRRGPVAAAKIDHVRIAHRQSEKVMPDDPLPIAADIRAVSKLKFDGGGGKMAVANDKRCPLKVDIPLVDGSKGKMIQPGVAADDIDGGRAVELHMRVANLRLDRPDTAID